MKKQKVMISQPMQGRLEREIIEIRQEKTLYLEQSGFEVVDNFFRVPRFTLDTSSVVGVQLVPLYFLAKSLECMSMCDFVFFCKNWEATRECQIEYTIALAYGLKIIMEQNLEVEG